MSHFCVACSNKLGLFEDYVCEDCEIEENKNVITFSEKVKNQGV